MTQTTRAQYHQRHSDILIYEEVICDEQRQKQLISQKQLKLHSILNQAV